MNIFVVLESQTNKWGLLGVLAGQREAFFDGTYANVVGGGTSQSTKGIVVTIVIINVITPDVLVFI